jgi:hypothetical protein
MAIILKANKVNLFESCFVSFLVQFTELFRHHVFVFHTVDCSMDMCIKCPQELRQSNFLEVYQRQAEATFAFGQYMGLSLSFIREIYG